MSIDAVGGKRTVKATLSSLVEQPTTSLKKRKEWQDWVHLVSKNICSFAIPAFKAHLPLFYIFFFKALTILGMRR